MVQRMTAIKAHFDGRVLVPDEPLNLPVNRALTVYVDSIETDDAVLGELAAALDRMPDHPGTPTDLAAQHDHYLHGLPKRP